MKIDYNTFTEEQLEEWIEFVDWSMVPYHLLTENIRRKFHSVPGLQVRLWFEELLNSLEVKINEERYPNRVFFFKENEWYMDWRKSSKSLWCSYDRIWSVFENKIGRNYDEIQRFIKNVVEMHFKFKEVTLVSVSDRTYTIIMMERHFKIWELTPQNAMFITREEEEKHFKLMKNIFYSFLQKTFNHVIRIIKYIS